MSKKEDLYKQKDLFDFLIEQLKELTEDEYTHIDQLEAFAYEVLAFKAFTLKNDTDKEIDFLNEIGEEVCGRLHEMVHGA